MAELGSKPSFASTSNWADDVEAEEQEFGRVATGIDPAALPGAPPSTSSSPRSYPSAPPTFSAAPPIPDHPPFKCFISNVHFDIDEEAIAHFFRGLAITDIIITRHADTQRPRGVFVEFDKQDDLKNALKLNGADMLRRSVTIQVAEPRRGPGGGSGGDRRQRPRGGGGGGGGGRYFDDGPSSGMRGRGRRGDGFGSGSSFRDRDREDRGERGSGNGRWGSSNISSSSGTNYPRRPPPPSVSSSSPTKGSYDGAPLPSSAPSVGERPKLILQPRGSTTGGAAAAAAAGGDEDKGKPNPFGSARPIDTASKLREIEEREREHTTTTAMTEKESGGGEVEGGVMKGPVKILAPPPPPPPPPVVAALSGLSIGGGEVNGERGRGGREGGRNRDGGGGRGGRKGGRRGGREGGGGEGERGGERGGGNGKQQGKRREGGGGDRGGGRSGTTNSGSTATSGPPGIVKYKKDEDTAVATKTQNMFDVLSLDE